MHKKIALISLLVITNMLTACSSVPLSTMLKLSSFNEQSVLSINPENIRAKITVNNFIDIDLENTKLGLTVESSQGNLALQFPLEKLTLTGNSATESFFSSTPASQTYLLQLSPVAVADFKKLQKQLRASQENSFGFSVGAKLKKKENLTNAQKDQALFMTIELKLDAAEEFFTLIDNAEIKNGKSEI